MSRDFKTERSALSALIPLRVSAMASFPSKVDARLTGRIELAVGTLGAGKTTWAAMRARRIAHASGRSLATTGIDWPLPWVCISSFEQLFELRDCVLVLEEVHLILSSSRGLLGKDVERSMVKFLSLCRKRGICVVSTTQAWTRVATHYRQLVTMVWLCKARRAGRLHSATGHCVPDEGGTEVLPAQYYRPSDAHIPTNASAWMPYAVIGDDDVDQEQEPDRKPPAKQVVTGRRTPKAVTAFARAGLQPTYGLEIADWSDDEFELWLNRRGGI